MCIAKELTIEMLKLIGNIDFELKKLQDKVLKTSQAQQDILHEIELTSFDAYNGWYLAKRIKTIREERRQYKDELAKMKSLKSFMDRNKNNLKNELNNVLKAIDVTEVRHEQRTYEPKIENIKIENKSNNPNNLNQLRKVNQTNIKFRSRPQYEKVTELLKQISTN